MVIEGDEKCIFKAIDKIDTGYETVDLGRLTRSANWSLAGNLDVGALTKLGGATSVGLDAAAKLTSELAMKLLGAKAGLDATSKLSSELSAYGDLQASGSGLGSANVGETLGEEIALRKRYVNFAIYLDQSRRELKIIREGTAGIDLTGSLVVDVAMGYNPSELLEYKPVFSFRQAPQKNGIEMDYKMYYIPIINGKDLRIKISGNAWIRKVRCRGYSIREGDDHITYKQVEIPETEYGIYMEPSDMPSLYKISYINKKMKFRKETLGVVHGTTEGIIRFGDLYTANEFIYWLMNGSKRAEALKNKGFILKLDDGKIDKEKILQTYLNEDNGRFQVDLCSTLVPGVYTGPKNVSSVESSQE